MPTGSWSSGLPAGAWAGPGPLGGTVAGDRATRVPPWSEATLTGAASLRRFQRGSFSAAVRASPSALLSALFSLKKKKEPSSSYESILRFKDFIEVGDRASVGRTWRPGPSRSVRSRRRPGPALPSWLSCVRVPRTHLCLPSGTGWRPSKAARCSAHGRFLKYLLLREISTLTTDWDGLTPLTC